MIWGCLLIGITSIFVSGLTLFSGFGLGTLLMPVFAIFFPVEVAVAATAVVHWANSFFKIIAVGRYANRKVAIKFGIPAVLAAFAGANLLSYVSQFTPVFEYRLWKIHAVVTPVKILMGILIFAFAILELSPRLKNFKFKSDHLIIGGILSGFFGGLSGHQGALRAAFLAKAGLTPQEFVGTSSVISFFVDITRISIYAYYFILWRGERHFLTPSQFSCVAWGITGAFLGITVGKRFIHKVTIETVQVLTGSLLILISLGLATGII